MRHIALLKRKLLNKAALLVSLVKLHSISSKLNSKSVVIDCGANVGDITAVFAKKGITVYAFEPDPDAFKILQNRFKAFPNVHLYNRAVWIKQASLFLFMHKYRKSNEKELLVSSSLFSEKVNINNHNKISVKTIDLVAFINGLNKEIDVIKMDVEGAEIEILKAFIDNKTYEKFKLALVETHETKIPGHAEEVHQIKTILKEKNIENIKLNWI